MRITLSGAMRARDVSRPTDEQLAAAAEREARIDRAVRPGSASKPRGPGSAASTAAAVAEAAPSAAAVAEVASAPAALAAADGAAAAPTPKPPVRTDPATVRSADGAGENEPTAGERAAGEPTADEMVSPTRRRRRRRGR